MGVRSKRLPQQKMRVGLNLVYESIMFGGQSQQCGHLEKDKLITNCSNFIYFRELTITHSHFLIV